MLSLLFNNFVRGITGSTGRIANLDFDATISELHQAESRVTSQPVEQGVNISDHIANEPLRMTIEGFVTNSPLSGGGFGDRVQDAFNTLFELRANKTLVTVVSGLKIYDNMAITRISVPRDRSSGDAIRFTVDLQEVLTSDFSSVFTPMMNLLPGPIRDQASSFLNLGRQATQAATSQLTSKATDIIGGLF